MTGIGNIGMDVALFMLTAAAAAVSGLMTWRNWHEGAFAVLRLLRCIGWSILAARYSYVLSTTGDVLIAVPTAIGLAFLACGDIAIVFFKGRWVRQ